MFLNTDICILSSLNKIILSSYHHIILYLIISLVSLLSGNVIFILSYLQVSYYLILNILSSSLIEALGVQLLIKLL